MDHSWKGERRGSPRRLIPLLAAPLLLVACDSLSPFGAAGIHRLVLALPVPPASWTALAGLRFRLSWRGASGEREEAVADPGAEREISVQRGRFQAILAEPFLGGRCLRPAGALYPQNIAGPAFGAPIGTDRLVLDWLGGYVATAARALEEADLDAAAFNLARLGDEARTRVTDPWLLPAREAAARLAAGTFRADSFREPPRFAVSLPGPGPWAPESPFAAAPDADGEAWTARLPSGSSFFLGQGLDLLVSVDESGAGSWVRLFQQSRSLSGPQGSQIRRAPRGALGPARP